MCGVEDGSRERQGEGQERSKDAMAGKSAPRPRRVTTYSGQKAEGSQCGAGPATDILTPGKSAASSRPGLPTPLGTASPISSLVNATMSENIAAAQQARVDGQIGQLPSQFGMLLLSMPRPWPPVTCRALQRRYRVGCAGMFAVFANNIPRAGWLVGSCSWRNAVCATLHTTVSLPRSSLACVRVLRVPAAPVLRTPPPLR